MIEKSSAALRAEAEALEVQAKALRECAHVRWQAEQAARPLLERMVFAADARCVCGAGLAYDPADPGEGVFKGPSQWKCSAILRFKDLSEAEQSEVRAATHDRGFDFAFYEIKSELQASAGARTTRPSTAAAAE